MNRLQRVLLGMMLAVNALLVLLPPFERRNRYEVHDWFFSRSAGRIDFATLTYEILIVLFFGSILVAFARRVSDEKNIEISRRLRSLLRWIAMAVGFTVIVACLLVLALVLWAMINAPK